MYLFMNCFRKCRFGKFIFRCELNQTSPSLLFHIVVVVVVVVLEKIATSIQRTSNESFTT